MHVDRADRLGNVQTVGPDPYFDEQFARAATRCYVSCEALSERLDVAHPDDARCNIVERSCITGVVEAPCGAHPTSNPPAYGWDMEHLKSYSQLATEEGGWQKYRGQFVDCSEADYLERVGGVARVRALAPPVF